MRTPIRGSRSLTPASRSLTRKLFTTLAATAVAAAGIVGLAPAASAADHPFQVDVTVPATVLNDGSRTATGSFKVTNLTANTYNGANLGIRYAVKAPGLTAKMLNAGGGTGIFSTSVDANNPIVFKNPSEWPALFCDAGTICGFTSTVGPTIDGFTKSKGTETFGLTIKLDTGAAALTSDLTVEIAIIGINGDGDFTGVMGLGTAVTSFIDVDVPTLSKAVPAAQLRHNYRHTVIESFGEPRATMTVARSTDHGATWSPITAASGSYALGGGFSLNATTGAVTAAGTTLTTPDADPATRYRVELAQLGRYYSTTFALPVLFTDVPAGHQFFSEIYRAAAANITGGYDDGSFGATKPVTRLAFATFAVKYLNPQAATGTCSAAKPSPFTDVPNSASYCAQIRDLAALGITTGYGDGTFKPGANITRQAISAMIYRTHLVELGRPVTTKAPVCTAKPFTDVAVTHPFCAEIRWMGDTGISTGTNGAFKPSDASSRQATIVFLDRLGRL